MIFDLFGTSRILNAISQLEKKLMADVVSINQQLTDLTAAVQTTNTTVSALAADVNAVIAALKAQIGAGTPVTQDQLDTISASIANIKAAVDTANAALVAEDQDVKPI